MIPSETSRSVETGFYHPGEQILEDYRSCRDEYFIRTSSHTSPGAIQSTLGWMRLFFNRNQAAALASDLILIIVCELQQRVDLQGNLKKRSAFVFPWSLSAKTCRFLGASDGGQGERNTGGGRVAMTGPTPVSSAAEEK